MVVINNKISDSFLGDDQEFLIENYVLFFTTPKVNPMESRIKEYISKTKTNTFESKEISYICICYK